MVIKDKGETVGATPEGQQAGVIGPWPAMHEHHRVSVSDDFYK